VETLNIEASVRFDSYSDVGNTTNPKVSATWGVIDGLQLKGAWGTAFRAPSPPNIQAISGGLLQGVNTLAGAASNTVTTCPQANVAAVPGSPAAVLDPNCTAALQNLGGITLSGGEQIASAVRPANYELQPEKAQNVSAGFEWAPTDDIFKGLDIEATYYFVLIRGKLQGCTSQGLDSPLSASCYLYAGNDPNFAQQVVQLLGNPKSQLPLGQSPANISYIFDGAIRNIGWQSANGVDFNGSYNFDAGDFGAWNAGISGNYIIDNKSQTEPGLPVISMYSTPANGTANSGGRLRYRARLGWNGGPDDAFGITGFMNFFSHQNMNGQPLAPLCFLQGEPACDASGMPQYAQYTQQYPTLNNLVPGLYTFDLQLSYRTKDVPANNFLKNIDLTLMVSDLFDKATPFQYVTSNPGRGAATGTTGGIISIQQRVILLTVTKNW
jgi:iron complex outermembrane receptor protein